jgi:hypothetical protein
VVESVRRGVSDSLFPKALDILSGSSLAFGFDERFDMGIIQLCGSLLLLGLIETY